MVKYKWIPANLDPQVKIKEKDSAHYNMLFERRLVGSDAKRPIVRIWVQCFRTIDYFKYFEFTY